jgi:hypothetical protein
LQHVGQQHCAFPVQAGEFHRFAGLAPSRCLTGATGEHAGMDSNVDSRVFFVFIVVTLLVFELDDGSNENSGIQPMG